MYVTSSWFHRLFCQVWTKTGLPWSLIPPQHSLGQWGRADLLTRRQALLITYKTQGENQRQEELAVVSRTCSQHSTGCSSQQESAELLKEAFEKEQLFCSTATLRL